MLKEVLKLCLKEGNCPLLAVSAITGVTLAPSTAVSHMPSTETLLCATPKTLGCSKPGHIDSIFTWLVGAKDKAVCASARALYKSKGEYKTPNVSCIVEMDAVSHFT